MYTHTILLAGDSKPAKMAYCQSFLGCSKDKQRSDIGAF